MSSMTATSEIATAASQLPSFEQLYGKKQQLEREIQVLSQSFGQLKTAQDKFMQNIATLQSLKSCSKGEEVMIPLTSSVYVTAQLENVEKVLVDVGTGYFMEKSIESADQYYVRKVKYLQEQLAMIANVLDEKKQDMSLVSQAMNISLKAAASTRNKK